MGSSSNATKRKMKRLQEFAALYRQAQNKWAEESDPLSPQCQEELDQILWWDMDSAYKELVRTGSIPLENENVSNNEMCIESEQRGPDAEVTEGPVPFQGFNDFAREVREISRKSGFDNPQRISETEMTCTKLILIIDEVCEALHEVRKTQDLSAFGEELADVIIRTFDLSYDLDLDMDAIISGKMAKNRKRAHKHGHNF